MSEIMSDHEEVQWWRSFHVMEMADLFLQRQAPEELKTTTEFLIHELGLRPGQRVYDQCCGIGTLSQSLGREGIEAVGADLVEAYIQRAKEECRGLPCQFFCADAFEFRAPLPCHGAFNWYSSFGYADRDEENIKMLERAFESLLPGGAFALDVPNFPGVLRGFQRYLVRKGKSNGRQVTCVRESHIDLKLGALKQTWDWIIDGKTIKTRHSSLRLYFPHQIQQMMCAVGFDQVRMFGGLDNSDLDLDSPRLIVVARKPQ